MRGFRKMLKEVIMTTGTVKWFNPAKGFGFIEPEDGGADAFVHISAVEAAGLSTLNDGQKVSYELKPGQNGKSSAENLTIAE
jgi:cold shock protein